MTRPTANVVICGAGIAGIAAAYHLAVRHGVRDILLVDERAPLTLTSDKGTQGYRNWWPGPDATMLRFMTRSLDLLEEVAEESGNVIRLNRRGYVFVTGRTDEADALHATARELSARGMGPLREHRAECPDDSTYQPAPAEGYRAQPAGADLLLGAAEIGRAFPYVTPEAVAALHVRRAGWMNAVALGTWMLTRALGAGVRFERARVTGVRVEDTRVRGVTLSTGATVDTDRLVIAAGPHVAEVGRMLGVEVPVFHELHAKMLVRDRARVVAREAPFLIWTDPQELPWSEAEREQLAARVETRRLLEPFPGGVHLRPVDGPFGDELWLIWTYDIAPRAPVWPPVFDAGYGAALLRGAARLVPALATYFGEEASGVVDGGYYCKTRENRPLIGPLAVEGAYIVGGLSGYGIMGSHAAADLLAAHVTGSALPEYARWFLPSRYDDPTYQALVAAWGAGVGQL